MTNKRRSLSARAMMGKRKRMKKFGVMDASITCLVVDVPILRALARIRILQHFDGKEPWRINKEADGYRRVYEDDS